MHTEFAEWFKSMRKEKCMIQKDAAAKIGITPQTICTIEKGGSVGISTLKKIAKYFKMPADKVYEIYSK